MIRHFHLFPIILFTAILNTTTIKATISSPQDSIKIEAINKNCIFINKPTSYNIEQNSIEIEAAKGTDLFHFPGGGYNRSNTPVLLFNADKDFTLSAKVSANFDSDFDGAFLVMYNDSANYAKLLFELNPQKELVICTGVTNKFTDDNVNAKLNRKEIYLKIGKKEKLFVFYYSTDGKKWNIARFFRFKNKKNLKLGFGTQSPVGENCTGFFSEIKYSPVALKDPAKGE